MAIVTLSGQIGTNAREVGRLVAERLGFGYVDQEILVEAARELGVPMEAVVTHDERTKTFGERIASILRHFLERSAAAGAADPMLGSPGGLDVMLSRTYAEAAANDEEISDEDYIQELGNLIQDIADHDNVLIIGRGSQVILRDQPNATHVLLVAPREQRIDSYAERHSLSREEAEKLMDSQDKGRVSFHQKFFDIDVNDPSHYQLTLNAARLSTQQVASIIVSAAQLPDRNGGSDRDDD